MAGVYYDISIDWAANTGCAHSVALLLLRHPELRFSRVLRCLCDCRRAVPAQVAAQQRLRPGVSARLLLMLQPFYASIAHLRVVVRCCLTASIPSSALWYYLSECECPATPFPGTDGACSGWERGSCSNGVCQVQESFNSLELVCAISSVACLGQCMPRFEGDDCSQLRCANPECMQTDCWDQARPNRFNSALLATERDELL